MTFHPVLEAPWEYRIERFDLDGTAQPAVLRLTLRRAQTVRVLRFTAPREVRLVEGFVPGMNASGIAILDVRSDQNEGLRVRVSDVVGGQDCQLQLWAASVELEPVAADAASEAPR